jgi:hypothetical protein
LPPLWRVVAKYVAPSVFGTATAFPHHIQCVAHCSVCRVLMFAWYHKAASNACPATEIRASDVDASPMAGSIEGLQRWNRFKRLLLPPKRRGMHMRWLKGCGSRSPQSSASHSQATAKLCTAMVKRFQHPPPARLSVIHHFWCFGTGYFARFDFISG